MSEAEEMIATYHEVRFDGKRTFELFGDCIRVHGSATLVSTFDTTIPLKQLSPRVSKLFLRSKSFWTGMWLALAGLIAAVLLFSIFEVELNEFAGVLIVGIAAGGLLTCCVAFPKTEFATFSTEAGINILDIARAGPNKDQFDHFVLQVLEQIKAVHRQG